jgi:hypothetical protein
VFFTHGDRGGEPVLVSFDAAGRLLDEHRVTNAENIDWEDISAAPCPDEGWCLYIGDIGDNDAVRESISVWVVREPEEGDRKIRAIEQYVGVFPDGPHDAEALMVQPCSGRIHLVTKDKDGASVVYRFPPLPEGASDLERVAQLQLDGPTAESREVTGGAWDDDGDRVALRTADRVFEWRSDPERPNAHWTVPPLEIVGAGEALGLGEGLTYGPVDDGDTDLYGVGEGSPIPLSRYACEGHAPAAADAVCEFPQTGRSCGCATGTLLAPGAQAASVPGVLGLAALAALAARVRRARAPGRATGRTEPSR